MKEVALALDGLQLHIAISADHNGVEMKAYLITLLGELGHRVDDYGSNGTEEVDYPYLCAEISRAVADGKVDRGIVVGGSGHGETVACNKIRGIRAGLCRIPFDVEISRGNNNSNVLVLPAKLISLELAGELTLMWLTTPFRGGVHQRRVELIEALEDGKDLGAL